MKAGFGLSAASRSLLEQMDCYAANGQFDAADLDSIRQSDQVYRSRRLLYYLASLYLQLGLDSAAADLLSNFDTASREMKKFFKVLSYSAMNGLPVPRMNHRERDCIDYLETVIDQSANPIEQLWLKQGGFSIVGNAPGPQLQANDGCRIYFNSYRKNTRIVDNASIHVVTPSWQTKMTADSAKICITGNNIFYRRSRVWQKFIDHRNFDAVYCVPRSLWSRLYGELKTSPSAGLLMLAWVAESAQRNPQKLRGYVAGFSNGQTTANHAYDKEPASARHDWVAEAMIVRQLIDDLGRYCSTLSIGA